MRVITSLPPKGENFAAYQPKGATEPLHFDVTSTLEKAADKPGGQDKWTVTVTQREYGNVATFAYSTGTGFRAVRDGWATKPLPFRASVYDWERSFTVRPDAASVLCSLGSDYQCAADMPRGSAEAMDYLQAEFGHDGKASDLLRMVESLRENADKTDRLLRNTGIIGSEFAEWCHELDA